VQRDASTAVSALEAELVDDQAVGHSSGAAPAMRQALFVLPSRRGDGFRASIRGHLLELADPSPGHGLAPTPDDLLIASIASDLAWAARRLLRAQGLPDDVSVSAEWRTLENSPKVGDVSVTVTVSETLEAMSDALIASLMERVAARSLDEPVCLHLRCHG
jgi:putative redox protein